MGTGAVVKDLAKEAAPAVKEFLATAAKKAEPYIGSIGHSLSQTEEGKDVASLLNNYRRKTDQIFAGLHEQATQAHTQGLIPKMPESQELIGKARTAARHQT